MVSFLKRCFVHLKLCCQRCSEHDCDMKGERGVFLLIIVLLIGCLLFVYRWNTTIMAAMFQGHYGNGQSTHAPPPEADTPHTIGHTGSDAAGGADKDVPQTEYWRPRVLPRDLQGAEQDNPRLIREIRDYWIVPPSRWKKQLEHEKKKDYSQKSQSLYVADIMRIGQGFFLECGAADGETNSNSLFFEQKKNWTGLLVEPNRDYFQEMLLKNRNSYLLNACLSPEPRAQMLNFTAAHLAGGLTEYMEEAHRTFIQEHSKVFTSTTAQCFPLYSILLALGVTHVDFFSLDVEGAEMAILRTIPFSEVTLEVVMVEYADNMEKLEALRQFFKETGLYKEVGVVGDLDVVFKRKKTQLQ